MIRSICLVVFLLACVLQHVTAFDTPYHILKRQNNCVTCPANPPACPACPKGQECQITSQSCTQCAQSLCIDSQSLSTLAGPVSPTAKGSNNTGAIAGGIVGALVVVGCVVGGFFWYIRKKRRATHDMDVWLDKAEANAEDNEKDPRRATGATVGHDSTGESSHRSIASTTMSHASNVIPIGYIPSPLRNTMMSTDTGYTVGSALTSLPSPRSHPPTQFFSADDILRASLATNHRDTRFSDRDTMYSDRDTRYSNRDSVGTTYTRASIATNGYRSTAIIAAAPVPVQVRAQPKIITFGKSSANSSPIPAVPELTAEKVAEAERSRATVIAAASQVLARETRENTERSSSAGLGLNIPISIVPVTPRLSTISSVPTSSPTTPHPIRMSTFTDILESPILPDVDSMPSTPQLPPKDLPIMLSPGSPTNVDERRLTLPSDSSPSLTDKKHDREGVTG